MAVDFLDIAPLEAEEWTVAVKDKNGIDQDVTVHPFDASDIAYIARHYCARAKSIFQDLTSPDDTLDFVEAKPYIVALGFVGPARMRDKKNFDAVVAKVRVLPVPEQNRIFSAVWAQVFSAKKEEEGGAPPTAGEASDTAASSKPSASS